MDLVFFRRVPIDFNGGKIFFSPFFMLLLVEGKEKECLPKFGVLIFILAHGIKQFSGSTVYSPIKNLNLLNMYQTNSSNTKHDKEFTNLY